MNKPIQYLVQIDKITKKKDKTLSIVLGTQELSSQETTLIFDLMGKEVWHAMSETGMVEKDIEIPDSIKEFKNEKSLSERLRNVLFVYYDKMTDKKKPFDEWRKNYMEKLIEHWKNKID